MKTVSLKTVSLKVVDLYQLFGSLSILYSQSCSDVTTTLRVLDIYNKVLLLMQETDATIHKTISDFSSKNSQGDPILNENGHPLLTDEIRKEYDGIMLELQQSIKTLEITPLTSNDLEILEVSAKVMSDIIPIVDFRA